MIVFEFVSSCVMISSCGSVILFFCLALRLSSLVVCFAFGIDVDHRAVHLSCLVLSCLLLSGLDLGLGLGLRLGFVLFCLLWECRNKKGG